MRRTFTAAAAAALIASGATAATATAEGPCPGFTSSTGQCVNTQLAIGGSSYSVDWYMPNATPSALMLVEHGFSRNCTRQRNTSKAIMEKGLMVLCINANMSGGNPALGNALGDLLTSRAFTLPGGRAIPTKYIVGGHSAGGHFASVVGARLHANGYAGLKGAVMFDPVAADGFGANLAAISAGGTREVLSIAARPAAINSQNNSFGPLRDIANTFVGVQLLWTSYSGTSGVGGSCHTDSEGENGNGIGNFASGCTPTATQTARLRDLSSNWAANIATGAKDAAYWCVNAAVPSTCGAKITALTGGTLPLARLIPVV
jgi:hypothetical protein